MLPRTKFTATVTSQLPAGIAKRCVDFYCFYGYLTHIGKISLNFAVRYAVLAGNQKIRGSSILSEYALYVAKLKPKL